MLDTGIKIIKQIPKVQIGYNAIDDFYLLKEHRLLEKPGIGIFFIDIFFQGKENVLSKLKIKSSDLSFYVDSFNEPTTSNIDGYIQSITDKIDKDDISFICGFGGGTTLDTAKAVSNLLNNSGKASDYQGWDLLKNPGVYKIGIPTIFGTGAEATRTCVMTNKETGLKLGMNSEFTVFDQVLIDPKLASSVPTDQFFYTGMDAYIHCMEALNGSYRNVLGDAYSRECINLCKEVFYSDDIKSQQSLEKLSVASFLGGCSIATSYVGVVHPFSAALSVVFGTHHCIANCIVMRAMDEFYESGYEEFWSMAFRNNISIPEGIAQNHNDEIYDQLYKSTVIHSKPLTNALGKDFLQILTKEKVKEIFLRM